tara:strand:- start:5392 stop:8451 length:3060 start_codon:yes stop_codon:yes gene_type:complete
MTSFIVIAFGFNIQAQTIKGKVSDTNGVTLPGVNVIIKGTNNGVSSDFSGNYSITTSSNDAILVFSFVGFTTQEIEINGQLEIDVVLSESVYELDAVNLISNGYERISRNKLTGAAENIDKSFFENSYKTTLQEGLQGSVAGLQIFSNNNHPQAIPEVIIRGVGSAFQEGVGLIAFGSPKAVTGNPAMNTPGSPLYVIDGVPTFDGRDLSTINGNDIASITVLKDASATSIYGARAANGVIVVETKSGKSGKSRITYSSQFGSSEFTEMNGRANSSQLKELYKEGLINANYLGITNDAGAEAFVNAPYRSNGTPDTSNKPFNSSQNTDWGKELTRNGQLSQHNISASGGKDGNYYYMSLGYLKNDSPVKEIDFDRVNFKVKYDTKLSQKLNVSTSLGFSKANSNNHEVGTSYYNPFTSINRIRPDFSIYNADGKTYNTGFNFAVNPLGILTDETRKVQTNDFRGALNLNYEITPGLTFETALSGDYELTENYDNFPSYLGKGYNNSRKSYAIQKNTNVFNWNARALLRYITQIGDDHNLNIFLGSEGNAVDVRGTNVSVENMGVGSETLDNGSTIDTYTTRNESAINSLFLNANYDFQEKYLVTASLRRDGSSRFGENSRYGNFYAVGFGWNLHKEDFTNDIEAINVLKLRTSYGMTGNDQISAYGYSGTFSTTDPYNGWSAATLSSAGNASISWEENVTFDIGFDFSLFNNRISGFLDYYNRKTSKLLYNLPTSGLNGDNYVFQNFGGMENSGVELSLNTKNIISKTNGLEWNSWINLSSNKNKVTELDSDNIISQRHIRKIGSDFNTLILYGWAGVDPATGNELYFTDESKTETTTSVGSAKKFDHGKTTPDFYGSFTNIISYRNFSVTAQLYSSWGGQIYDVNGYAQNDNGYRRMYDYSNTSKYVYDNRWQKPGDITNVPMYKFGNSFSNNYSSRWLHDGSYVRLKKLELAYSFPNNLLENTFISSMRLHVSGDNLWTYVKDDTLTNDPEIGGITGIASWDTPLSKTFYLGLNVSF